MSGSHGAVTMVVRSFYQAFSSLTGMVGLTPAQVGAGVVGLVVVAFVFQAWGMARNRTGFSLDPVDRDGE